MQDRCIHIQDQITFIWSRPVFIDLIGLHASNDKIISGTTKVLNQSKERAMCEIECDGGRDKVIESSFYRRSNVDIRVRHIVRSSQVHVKYKFNPFGTHAH